MEATAVSIISALRENYPNTELFLVRIFLYSDWIRRFTPWISVFSPNTGKYGPEITPYLDFFCTVLGNNKDLRTKCGSKRPVRYQKLQHSSTVFVFSSGQISQFYIDFYCLLPLNKLYLLLEGQVCFLCVFSVFLSFFMVGNALSLRCYMSYWGSKLKRLDMMYTKKLLNP